MNNGKKFGTTCALKNNYHDSQLRSFSIGPRNELTLEVQLDPVWNPGGPSNARIRFGAIENLDEVKRFFNGIALPRSEGAFLTEVTSVACERKATWILDLSDYGNIRIVAKHCEEL
jgi:hypothetical protein